MNETKKVWLLFDYRRPEMGKNQKWGDHSGWILTQAIHHCQKEAGDHWDIYDPDTGVCVYKSKKYNKTSSLLLLLEKR